MTLLDLANMMEMKEHQQVWSFDKKTRSGVSVNELQEKSMGDLKAIIGHQIQRKWDHCLLRKIV